MASPNVEWIEWEASDPDVAVPPGYAIDFDRTELTERGYRAPMFPRLPCHYCKGMPDSHEVDHSGNCAACQGSGIHPEGDDPHDDGEGWSGDDCGVCRVHCDGCDEDRNDVSPYVVTHHDRTTSDADYCRDCAALAKCDWNGETASIAPRRVKLPGKVTP